MFWFWFILTIVFSVVCGLLALAMAADPEGRGLTWALLLFTGALFFAASNVVITSAHLWRRFKGWA
jgi:hypothetical protein